MTARLIRRLAGRRRWAVGVLGGLLLAGGAGSIGVAAASQDHAPQPGASQAGSVSPAAAAARPHAGGPGVRPGVGGRSTTPAQVPNPAATSTRGPVLARSVPVSITIPRIGVHSAVFEVGLNPDGTIQVPPLSHSPLTNEAAWYRYSPTPGQIGPSIIEGHIDSAAQGPSVFYRLGALRPGDTIDVGLRDGVVALFRVTGVRQYPKSQFPTATVYGNTDYAGLRLLTCGGTFDAAVGHYLSNTVVYASLVGSRRTVGDPAAG